MIRNHNTLNIDEQFDLVVSENSHEDGDRLPSEEELDSVLRKGIDAIDI